MTDTKTMELIGGIAENVSEKNLSEITYETEDVKIRVVGKQPQPTQIQVVESQSNVNSDIQQSSNTQIDERYIVSPMVGVVYLKQSPDKKSYVSVGDDVNIDTTVCLIEAMKTYNPIKANMKGKIRAILVKDGDPVEYGKPLFSIV